MKPKRLQSTKNPQPIGSSKIRIVKWIRKLLFVVFVPHNASLFICLSVVTCRRKAQCVGRLRYRVETCGFRALANPELRNWSTWNLEELMSVKHPKARRTIGFGLLAEVPQLGEVGQHVSVTFWFVIYLTFLRVRFYRPDHSIDLQARWLQINESDFWGQRL